MSNEAASTKQSRSWLVLGALLIAAAVVAAVTGIAIAVAFGTNPVIVFLAYGVLAAGFLICAIYYDARWRGARPTDAAGTVARRGNARLVWFGCAWVLLPTVLLLALGLGLLLGPSLHSSLFFDPPRVGESAEQLRLRLGPPIVDYWSGPDTQGVRTRHLGYMAPDGKRFTLSLDDAGVVVEISTYYR